MGLSTRAYRILRSSLAVILIAASVFLLVSCDTAALASGDEALHFKYITENGSVTVTGPDGDCPVQLVIPDTVGGLPVTAIAERAFCDEGGLVSVSLPRTLLSIGASAFLHCTSLVSAELPESLSYIGSDAFMLCGKLDFSDMPSGITHVGADAFTGMAWLSSKPDGPVYAGKVLCGYREASRPS